MSILRSLPEPMSSRVDGPDAGLILGVRVDQINGAVAVDVCPADAGIGTQRRGHAGDDFLGASV